MQRPLSKFGLVFIIPEHSVEILICMLFFEAMNLPFSLRADPYYYDFLHVFGESWGQCNVCYILVPDKRKVSTNKFKVNLL